jgi:uncharacterized protein
MTASAPFSHPGPPPARPELPEGVTPPEPPEGMAGLPRLGVPVWAPFVALLATFAGVLVLATIVGIGIAIAGGDAETDSDALVLSLTAAQAALLVAVAWFTVRLLSRPPVPASFGLRGTPALPALGWSALAYAGFWVMTLIILVALGEPDDQELVQDIQDESAFAVLAGYAVLSCLLAPLAEEFFFRGFMFRALAERVRPVLAALITGGVFGVIHLPGAPAQSVLVLAIFGAALCFVLARTGSLIPCIMLHALNNSIAFGATKELPWWGFLLLISGSVGTTFGVALLAGRLGSRRAAPAPA